MSALMKIEKLGSGLNLLRVLYTRQEWRVLGEWRIRGRMKDRDKYVKVQRKESGDRIWTLKRGLAVESELLRKIHGHLLPKPRIYPKWKNSELDHRLGQRSRSLMMELKAPPLLRLLLKEKILRKERRNASGKEVLQT
jgi:hypothetical protein